MYSFAKTRTRETGSYYVVDCIKLRVQGYPVFGPKQGMGGSDRFAASTLTLSLPQSREDEWQESSNSSSSMSSFAGGLPLSVARALNQIKWHDATSVEKRKPAPPLFHGGIKKIVYVFVKVFLSILLGSLPFIWGNQLHGSGFKTKTGLEWFVLVFELRRNLFSSGPWRGIRACAALCGRNLSRIRIA